MTELLYHTEIQLPAGFITPKGIVTVNYGSHAKREALIDRYGKIALPATIDLSTFNVIEVGMTNGRCSKILFRGKLDGKRDLCIVLIPNGNKPWYCKTCWVNLSTDTHKTLNRSRYVH